MSEPAGPAALPQLSPCSGACPDEATLAVLWEGQRFPKEALALTDGRPLRVIYRGRRQGGPGPDFRDAVIAVEGDGQRYGDVELHVRAADWRGHGHHLDLAYAAVALHVVFEPPRPGDTTATTLDGALIPTVALGPWVTRRAGDLAVWLSGPDRWREPCHGARAALGDGTVVATLRRLGLRRLRERAAAVAREIDGAPAPEGWLHAALYEALGYPLNREPFRRLAELCPWDELQAWLLARPDHERRELAEAILLRRSGLLAVDGAAPAGLRPRLLRLAAERGIRPGMAAGAWRRWGVRPDNRPERRIAGAAELAARFAADGPLAALAAAAGESGAALLAALSVPSTSLRIGGGGLAWGGGALIGRGRAIEMATNAVLPMLLALAEGAGHAAAVDLVERRYLELPRPAPYGRTAALERAIAADERSPLRGAAGQQALLYLQEHYCGRGKCGRCPLSP